MFHRTRAGLLFLAALLPAGNALVAPVPRLTLSEPVQTAQGFATTLGIDNPAPQPLAARRIVLQLVTQGIALAALDRSTAVTVAAGGHLRLPLSLPISRQGLERLIGDAWGHPSMSPRYQVTGFLERADGRRYPLSRHGSFADDDRDD